MCFNTLTLHLFSFTRWKKCEVFIFAVLKESCSLLIELPNLHLPHPSLHWHLLFTSLPWRLPSLHALTNCCHRLRFLPRRSLSRLPAQRPIALLESSFFLGVGCSFTSFWRTVPLLLVKSVGSHIVVRFLVCWLKKKGCSRRIFCQPRVLEVFDPDHSAKSPHWLINSLFASLLEHYELKTKSLKDVLLVLNHCFLSSVCPYVRRFLIETTD